MYVFEQTIVLDKAKRLTPVQCSTPKTAESHSRSIQDMWQLVMVHCIESNPL